MIDNRVTWLQNGQTRQADWHSESHQSPPKWLKIVDDQTSANTAYRLASEGAGMVYEGDFHNAKQLLQALARRVDSKPLKPAATLLETFHLHRAKQIQRANILNKLLVVLEHGQLSLKRAPALQEAVAQTMDTAIPARLIMPLRALLGMIGAYEWRKKGVPIPALGQSVHPYYGVYSPVRGEYLDLIAQALLDFPVRPKPFDNAHDRPVEGQTAMDIGTGTGVIAALLAKRGMQNIIATDNQPRALACAQENLQCLGYAKQVQVMQANLFPENIKADLIVCNPPWLPAKANAPIEHAVYDPESKMLKAFLSGVKAHLNADGEAWLIMSDLAERIGLRAKGELASWIAEAGLQVLARLDTHPKHSKANDKADPLFAARSKEITSLYRLKSA